MVDGIAGSSMRHVDTMDHLFSPCTRYRGIVESQGDLIEEFGGNLELPRELNLDVSTEELLSAERAFTYADLYALIGNEDTLAWLTPHTAVAREYNGSAAFAWELLVEVDTCCFRFSTGGKEIVAVALSLEHLFEICDVVLRLLAVSVVHSLLVSFTSWTSPDLFISSPALAYVMEQCQSLKALSLKNLRMDENHCRVLGDYSRPDLEIVLDRCKITSTGAGALREVLRRNQGPTKLDLCEIDHFVLANGLRGNSSLKSLRPHLSYNPEDGNRELVAIAGALRENRGLVELNLRNFRVRGETWDAVCDSLKTHPTLEVLDLHCMAPSALQESRIQALVDMMKVNMSMQKIHLHACDSQHELFRESVIPYLETNRLRPRLLAIQKTISHAYRAKVLGRALLAVRTDPNRFWILLSGNAEVVFPSTTSMTVTEAASLPNVAATDIVAPVVTTASATGASSVVASTAGQKRKACP